MSAVFSGSPDSRNKHNQSQCRHARGGLNPDVVEAGFADDPPVGHAIEGNAAGQAQVLGAGCFAQPDRALEEQGLRVVLNSPSDVFPMLHRWTRFPVALVLGPEWLFALDTPHGDDTLLPLTLDQH